MIRYPLRPLVDASGLSYDDARRHVGASGSDWARAMREGLSEAKADRWAVRLGRLAYEVWPEMVDEAIAELEQECAAPDCTERFVAPPKAWNKRYCSSRCCSRESMRAFRRTRKGREANRRYRREVMELRRRREMS